MTKVLTFPACRKSIVTAAQLASIENNYRTMAAYLEQWRDRLVDVNDQLESTRSETAEGLARATRSFDADKCESQSECGEQGAG